MLFTLLRFTDNNSIKSMKNKIYFLMSTLLERIGEKGKNVLVKLV